MKILKIILCLLFILLISSKEVYSLEAQKIIRVGISNQNFSTYHHQNASFTSKTEFSLVDMSETGQSHKYAPGTVVKVEADGSLFKVYKDGLVDAIKLKGPLVISSNSGIGIVGLNRKGSPAFYMGQVELKITGEKKFNIINVLSMQDYLRGVVPNEMPVTFGLEALKAQAVAARNYANRGITSSSNYDVCDSVACQVYYGANSYKPQSDQAVMETEGIYALYNREPIVALYFSTSSGITDSWEAVFSQGNNKLPKHVPYLVSVYDNPNFKTITSEAQAKDFFSNPYQSYDIKSPKYRWSVVFGQNELESVLKKTLIEQSKAGLVTPKFNSAGEFGRLKDIKVTKRGVSGKVLAIDIVTNNGIWHVTKELGIRRLFKKNNQALWSANFYIKKEGDSAGNVIKTIFDNGEEDDTPGKSEAKYTFYGAGFGHGVGMSQFGASYMASQGKNYFDILKHYYKGIQIGTFPKDITYDAYKKSYQIIFYKEKDYKYYLHLDNTKRISQIDFNINDTGFSPKLETYNAKTLFFDVTKYLHNGKNVIMVKSLYEKDKDKATKVWLEVRE